MSTEAPDFDAMRFKAQERTGFNRIAARYAAGAHLRADLAVALLDAAGLQPGLRVLDLASGPALLASDAATRVAPDGWVVATDIAEAMLAHAMQIRQQHAMEAARPDRLSFAAADAERLCFADDSFDRVLAGLALFMFPHPEQALAEIRRVLRTGGQMAVSVWGPRESVPLIGRAQDCIARLLPRPRVERPSVFRLGSPGVLESQLSAAGFTSIRVETCRFSCHFEDAGAYWQAFLDLAGGAAEALSRLPPAIQMKLREAVANDLEADRATGKPGYTVEAQALIAVATAN